MKIGRATFVLDNVCDLLRFLHIKPRQFEFDEESRFGRFPSQSDVVIQLGWIVKKFQGLALLAIQFHSPRLKSSSYTKLTSHMRPLKAWSWLILVPLSSPPHSLVPCLLSPLVLLLHYYYRIGNESGRNVYMCEAPKDDTAQRWIVGVIPSSSRWVLVEETASSSNWPEWCWLFIGFFCLQSYDLRCVWDPHPSSSFVYVCPTDPKSWWYFCSSMHSRTHIVHCLISYCVYWQAFRSRRGFVFLWPCFLLATGKLGLVWFSTRPSKWPNIYPSHYLWLY